MQILTTFIILLGATTAYSSVAAQPLTADRFVDRVMTGPSGRALDRQVDAEAARARGAGLWPNPSLHWSRESLPGSGVAQSTQDVVWLSVPLVLSGRTFTEAAAADDKVEAARLLRISRRADLQRRAIVLFYDALASQEKLQSAEVAATRFQSMSAILEKRASAGETSGYDALRVEIERTGIEDRVAGAAIVLASAKAEMHKMIGDAPGALGGALVPTEARTVGDKSPLVVRLRALDLEVKAARGRASAAARRAVPDPVLGVGLQRQGGEGRDAFLGYFVGVQIPLPLFDRSQGREAVAEATVARLEIERLQLLARASVSLSEATRRLEANQTRLSTQKSVAQKSASLVEIARKGYALGGVGLLTLIDAERSALEVRMRAIERAFDVRVAEADVAFLTGVFDLDEQGDAL